MIAAEALLRDALSDLAARGYKQAEAETRVALAALLRARQAAEL